MNTPLEVAVTISRLIMEARERRVKLDIGSAVDELSTRFPHSGYSTVQIAETLTEEASAAGVALH